jgi:subtilisin-like proprotein convertase family protein
MNLKKMLSGLFVMLLFLSLGMNVYSQDVQHSIGPAPFVTSTAEESPVFDMAPTSRAFSYNATSISASTLRKYFLGTPGTSTAVGGVQPFFFGGGDFCQPGGSGPWTFYVIQQLTPFPLFSVDTSTGTTTNLGNITGIIAGHVSGGVTSLAWDATTNTAYIASLTATVTQSQLYTLNLTTRVATPIGSPQTVAPGIITMGCNPAGTLFGIDLVNDRLYRINKTTGVPTALSSTLGYNANYGQDSDFDPRDGIYYWAAIGQTQPSQLRTVDTSTGTSTLIGIMTGTSQVLATGIPYPVPLPLGTFCRSNLGTTKPINDHQWTYDTLNVVIGAQCIVKDVNVRVDSVLHTFDGTLSFYLRKGSTSVKIINRVGGVGDNFIGTILNDSATIPIAGGTAPFTGSYIPSNPLTPFNNQPADGQWILGISDTANGDTGFLRAWCLVIAYQCPVGGIQTIEIPNYYALGQNYPNPFNPATTISFALPKAENVKLAVYDMLGREVAALVNAFKQAGIYEVPFDASSLSSGVYFYRLETGSFTETKKMLLVK